MYKYPYNILTHTVAPPFFPDLSHLYLLQTYDIHHVKQCQFNLAHLSCAVTKDTAVSTRGSRLSEYYVDLCVVCDARASLLVQPSDLVLGISGRNVAHIINTASSVFASL